VLSISALTQNYESRSHRLNRKGNHTTGNAFSLAEVCPVDKSNPDDRQPTCLPRNIACGKRAVFPAPRNCARGCETKGIK
jgi:hypothetical protein